MIVVDNPRYKRFSYHDHGTVWIAWGLWGARCLQ